MQTVKCGVQKSVSLHHISTGNRACGRICSQRTQNSVDFIVARRLLEPVQIFSGPGHIQEEALRPRTEQSFFLRRLRTAKLVPVSHEPRQLWSATSHLCHGQHELLCLHFPFEYIENGGWLMRSKLDQSVIVFSPACLSILVSYAQAVGVGHRPSPSIEL